MNLPYLQIIHKLTPRQTIVLAILSTRGHCASELGEVSKQKAATMQNAAEALLERKLVKRTKEKNYFFVYRLTEEGMNIAKKILECDLPSTPVANPSTDGPLIPGIFQS